MWSEWTEWSICDRHYRRQRSHVCDNPEPFCGGSDCHGDIVDESLCCQEPGEGQHANISYKSIDNTTVYLLPGHYYTYTVSMAMNMKMVEMKGTSPAC
ncbi:hypothetical protein EB796_002496 [Bugula neritina]|uniref:Uncharacterized protein n=1 Tax=Bugula neritina TaxID=10212 RepID=A0A7J7KM17_BUGNE|nr:hypothetical protein EB796_002496 [Bugula neritina]